MAERALTSYLISILAEAVPELAEAMDHWGAGSDEVLGILRECLAAAELDQRLDKAA
ncbi:hypothetical protein [Imhoffiella purpurea]|uniref:Uncharacterized protein n=1 Tax=Imhoffiella purpurea TaxID=1249627 RepID=W9VT76_9GAMM|nr:hypothetical protein [Imhoffiella purpurea]EXJ13590.1 hypothetical protein D779_3593 [Imhoffiella purpurea]